MTDFLLACLVSAGIGLLYRANQIADLLLSIRKDLFRMSENFATLQLVKTLARAVVAAQEGEKDAEQAREAAQAAFVDLKSQVTLDAEAEDLISRALGNAVHADPEPGQPIVDENQNGIPDSEEEEPAAEDTGDQEPILDSGEVLVEDDDTKPAPPSEGI